MLFCTVFLFLLFSFEGERERENNDTVSFDNIIQKVNQE